MQRLRPTSVAGNARVAITVVTAAGRATFTDEQIERLERAGPTTFRQAVRRLSPDELAATLDHATVAGFTPRAAPRLGVDEIAALPDSLQNIAVFATGVDFVDRVALEARGITLSSLPGYSTTTVAEHTIGLLLMLSRRLHLSRGRVLGRVPDSTSVRGWELKSKTIGVVGMGRIGRRVATLATAFGMQVVGTDVSDDVADGVRLGELDEVLSSADVVTLHASTSWGRQPRISAAELRLMQPHAHPINATRASLVDERAVVSAIGSGRLAGYAVDDRLGESVRSEAATLLHEGRIIKSGHTAWYSQEAMDRGSDAWVDTMIQAAQHQSASRQQP